MALSPGVGLHRRGLGPVRREWATERAWGATLGVGAFALIGLVLRLAVATRPLAVVDRLFVPDDTYYTLTIARSIAHGHGPTTDGRTLTSGFQPLLGFLMTPVYWVTGSADRALRIDLLLLVVADVATIVLLAWIAFRVAGRVAALVAAAIWAVSPIAITSAAGGLETSLAMLAAVGLVAVWIRANDRATTARWVIVGAVAGLAVLARIDVLLLVALLAVAQLCRGPRRPLTVAAAAGAVVVAPWWIWCTVNLGTPFPTSGSASHALATGGSFTSVTTSLAFGAVAGGPFASLQHPRVWLAQHTAVGTAAYWLAVVVLLTASAAWFRASTRERHDPECAPRVAVSALLAFAAGLLVFYAWFGITWYLSRYLAPVALVVTLLVAVGCARVARPPSTGPWRIAAGALAAVVVVGLVGSAIADHAALTRTVRKPSLLDAATGYREPVQRAVAFVPGGARIGGFQSGALGYFGGERHTVVNLDGVVNPDAYRAGRDGRMASYIRARRLSWLVDNRVVLQSGLAPYRRGAHALRLAHAGTFGFVNDFPYIALRVVGPTVTAGARS